MPQLLVNPDHWELHREDKRLIPLVVETYNFSTEEWTETSLYEVVCLPVGTRPASGAAWDSPTTDGGATGYLMDGLTLDPTQAGGQFWGFTKIDGNVQDPVDPAFTLTLK